MSPDGDFVALGYKNGQIHIASVAENEVVFSPKASPDTTWSCVAISVDGSRIATGAQSGHIAIWDSFDRSIIQSTQFFETPVDSIGFVGWDQKLVCHSGDTIVIAEADNLSAFRKTKGTAPVKFSSMGDVVLFPLEKEMIVYRIGNEEPERIAINGRQPLTSVAANGSFAILDEQMLIRNDPTSNNIRSFELPAFLSKPTWLCCLSSNSVLIGLQNGEFLTINSADEMGSPLPTRINSSETFVLTSNSHETLAVDQGRIVSISESGVAGISTEFTSPIAFQSVALSPNGAFILACDSIGNVYLIERSVH